MSAKDYTDKFCIIGAGAAGLAAAKNLKQNGVPFDVIEREDDVGGNWYYGKPHSSVYRSIHTITSKPFTQYTDFPLPDHLPTYINQSQAWEYLRSYARAFRLYQNIEFGRSVENVEVVGTNSSHWDVTLDGGQIRRYQGLIIANGHLWDPRFPEYPGQFSGRIIHSSEYKTPDLLRGKRVMVIGAGNSGCDIAVESSQNASHTFHSTRRGYYYWPKFLFGMPSDAWAEMPLRMRVPLFLRRMVGKIILKMFTTGKAEQYGLPKPDHKLFEAHYIINSTLMYHLAHGDITTKPDVKAIHGDNVEFTDGTEEAIDVIICATGFNLRFPFIDKAYLNWRDGRPELYMNIFHPAYDNLFVVGMFQTSTGNWPLMDYQSQLVARFLLAKQQHSAKAKWFRKLKAGPQPDINGGLRFMKSSRHLLECEHFSYRARLQKLIRKLSVAPPSTTVPSLDAERAAIVTEKEPEAHSCITS